MPSISVSKPLSADPTAVWELLADFGDVSWIPIATSVQTSGEGPGMRRVINGGGDQPTVEKLCWLDAGKQSLAYEIEQSPLPITRYEAVVAISDDPEPTITWKVDFEPMKDEESVREGLLKIYSAMAGWLDTAAGERR